MEYSHYSPIVLISAGVLLALLVLGLTSQIARRRSRIRHPAERYGTKYDGTVEQLGGGGKAEDLIVRENGVEHHAIRPLSDAERLRFARLWGKALARYSAVAAVSEADQLLTEVMRARDFPTADFDQRAANLSVEHPRLAENYHAAHDLALKSRRGRASAEDLRQALVHYRVLFEELVEVPPLELAAAR
jgi:hypothetical protein